MLITSARFSIEGQKLLILFTNFYQIIKTKQFLLIVCLSVGQLTILTAQVENTFYVPMPESQIHTAFKVFTDAKNRKISSQINSVISIVATDDNTIIYYDHWEDGYESDIENSVASSTQVWGDNNNANGKPPGYANDIINAGDVIKLENSVALPRNTTNKNYDGGDKIASTAFLAISRAAWAPSPGPVLSGAVELLETGTWGIEYQIPIGEDVITNQLFDYVGVLIMAKEFQTTVNIDTDGDGTTDLTASLNEGETYHVKGGIETGAVITANHPVQAHLITGDKDGYFENRWFTLFPCELWDDSYYNPVGTTKSNAPTYVFLYNPNPSNIQVNYSTLDNNGSFNIDSKSVYLFEMPMQSGAHFYTTTNAPFFALSTIDSEQQKNNDAHDWGFTLIPETYLTVSATIGWGPGNGGSGNQNGSPAWVTAIKPTTIYVDYDGDPNTGSSTDVNGDKYDVSYSINAYESLRIFDNNDNDQTGLLIYTIDGTLISTAWGQDPATALPGNPYLDFGTTVPPIRKISAWKDYTLTTDNNGNELVDQGDIITFSITLKNTGNAPILTINVKDTLPTEVTYIANSTRLNGTGIPDKNSGTAFPLDEGGYNKASLAINQTDVYTFEAQVNTPPPSISTLTNYFTIVTRTPDKILKGNVTIPIVASTVTVDACELDFTDNSGSNQSFFTENMPICITVSDTDQNTDVNSTQDLKIFLLNNATNDRETVCLTETGNNTGVFRGCITGSASNGIDVEDGVIHAVAGNTLEASFTDPIYEEVCTNTTTLIAATESKILYLSSPGQGLDRIDPVTTHDMSTVSAPVSNSGNSDWLYERKLTFNTNQSENLLNFPVLVILNSSRIDYNNTQNNGEDLRFFDADKTTALSYEIEEWNESGTSYVWVHVPQIDGASNTDHIWMHYGNAAAPNGEDKESTWHSSYKGVWHLNEASGQNKDATLNNNHGTAQNGATQNATGKIGKAVDFDGSNDYINIPDDASLDISNQITISGWVNSDAFKTYARIVDKSHSSNSSPYTSYGMYVGNNQFLHFQLADGGSDGTLRGEIGIGTGQWTYLVGTYDGTKQRVYLNGNLDKSDSETITMTPNNNPLTIGAASYNNPVYFDGKIDEIRVANVARSAGWIAAQYASMTDALVTFGSQEQVGNSSSANYMAIFKQSIPMCTALDMPMGGVITILNHITVSSGTLPANPDISATLLHNDTPIATLTNPVLSGGTSESLSWSHTLNSDYSIPVGDTIKLQVDKNDTGYNFNIDYDSETKPSHIKFPVTTVIEIEELAIYDAPYPDGQAIQSLENGQTAYIRTTVSDPFGPYDITSLDLIITTPSSNPTSLLLEDNQSVATTGCKKIYEYTWKTSVEQGIYSIQAISHEGYEGITDSLTTAIEVSQKDLGTSCIAQFTNNNFAVTHSYELNEQICMEVTDIDENKEENTIESLTVTLMGTNDIETVHLIETGTNTGLFQACINASNTISNNEDGQIYAPSGSLLSLEYIDAEDSTDICNVLSSIKATTPTIQIQKTLVQPIDGIALVNEPIHFRIVVSNTGNTTISNLALADVFDHACMAYTTSSIVPDATAAGTLDWNNIGPLSTGESSSIDVFFTATSACALAQNTANASGTDENNTAVSAGPAIAGVEITKPAIAITKTLISPTATPYLSTDTFTFRIDIDNIGTTNISTLPLLDIFSGACLAFESASISPNGVGSGTVLWEDLGNLSTGNSISLTTKFSVLNNCKPTINEASINFAIDENGDLVPAVQDTAVLQILVPPIALDDGAVTTPNTSVDIIALGNDSDGDHNLDTSRTIIGVLQPSNGSLLINPLTGVHTYTPNNGFVGVDTYEYIICDSTDLCDTALVTISISNNICCATSGQNLITGTIFSDANENGLYDGIEIGIGGFKVYLYEDSNKNGTIDNGETSFAQGTTNAAGTYAFMLDEVTLPSLPTYFVIAINELDLPVASKLSTASDLISVLTIRGQENHGHDFGYVRFN